MEKFLATITPLGPARAKAMFGGYGVFLDDQMFAKILSKGVVALKAGKMTYYEVQAVDYQDGEKILAWSRGAVAAASRQAAGKKK